MNQTQLWSLAAVVACSSLLLWYRRSSGSDQAFLPIPSTNTDYIDMDELLNALTAPPRGVRNNNPGNIEDNGTPWRGRVGNDGRFIVFDNPVNGIRAISRILDTYSSNGFTTLEKIISRWAPPVENNTESYIQHAEKALKLTRYTPIGEQHKAALIKVIIQHENGVQPYSDKVIYDGIAAA